MEEKKVLNPAGSLSRPQSSTNPTVSEPVLKGPLPTMIADEKNVAPSGESSTLHSNSSIPPAAVANEGPLDASQEGNEKELEKKDEKLDAEDDPDNYPHGLKLLAIISALCMAVFLVALDQTIVSLGRVSVRFCAVSNSKLRLQRPYLESQTTSTVLEISAGTVVPISSPPLPYSQPSDVSTRSLASKAHF